MAITAQCGSCNKKFKANDQLAGKRVKCPQCGGGIAIPVPQPVESPGSVASLLDEEAVPTKPVAKPKPKPAVSKKCPSCSAEITPGAVLCVNCGFDLRTGKPVEVGSADAAEPGEKKKKRKKKKKRRQSDTSQAVLFLRGCAVSFGFAMVGAIAWWMTAYFWGVEFGIIAWVLGGLAGAGMSFGYGIEDLLSGLAAAAIAVFAIFVAKVLICVAVLNNPEKFLGEEFDDAAMEEAFNEEFPNVEMGDEADISEDQSEGEEGDEESADDQTSEVADGEMFNEEEFGGEFDEDFGDFEEPDGGGGALIIIAAIVVGFISMFWPPFNILFLLLACATAYQVGSGGGWAD